MRFVCIAALMALVYSISFIPQIILNDIPKTEYVRPVSMDYQEKVVASGYITSSAMREAYISSPLIASELRFSVGDTVQKGDVIAVIDTEQTKAALQNSITAEQS
ncbi:MAG: biotin/lipoyl-binding protein, partial [Oscillospiraceae bacterium]